ncbi:SPOR domain-containing protein [Arenibacterium sp. LLYu02]|uniref:SPOR domain-containing protein n=1 Tax=Arenibacterium sp. LLYu02 TaxID=3404132 RepID=UPI003B21C514
MAYFAQVGASAPSSNGDDDRGGVAFDPFASHKYSRASMQEPEAAEQDAPAANGFYPNFGLNPSQAFQGGARGAQTPSFSAAGANAAYAAAGGYPEAGYDDTGDYGDGFSGEDDDLFGPQVGQRGEFGRVAAMIGAAASIALVVSIGIWGYKLIMRDVSGVPVVSAVAGPMRVAPTEPGGETADHMGLAVNAVAATGIAEDPADTLQLAPQAIALTEDDQPIPTLTEAAEAEAALEAQFAAETADTAAMEGESSEEPLVEVSPLEQRSNDIDALVASLTEGAVPLSDLSETSASIVQPDPIDASAVVTSAAVPASVLNAPGVRATQRPKVRPARFAPAATVASASAEVAVAKPAAQVATVEIAPESLAVGTRLAQLGAYESAEVARTEWTRISARFGDFFNDKQRVVQRAESGGRIFYRLRAHGFEDLSDARRFCSALVAGNADCIPVTMR